MFGKVEESFSFIKDYTTSNEKGICCAGKKAGEKDLGLYNGVFFSGAEGKILGHAKDDFIDFLQVSCGIENALNKNGVEISINIGGELADMNSYKGRVINVLNDKIVINAFDERGASCALFDLEELMVREKSPILKIGQYKNKPLFSPRMVHSSLGQDEFPEGYLLRLLKEGIDTIIIFVRGINQGANDDKDINQMIATAEEYGLDTYAYSYLKNFNHPSAENAEEIYDKIYGDFFRAHPGFKGMIFVGESIEFPSKDDRVTCRHYYEMNEDNLPDSKLSPGWFPCKDYPEWLNLVKKSIRNVKPDADIVFWTYNWGWAPKKERIELLNSLPTDISLLVTFEMFQKYKIGKITEQGCDYSLVLPNAGDYFLSEAAVAKERGIRLYSQCNTGGRTWDFGVIPVEPFPYRWKTRYDSINACREKYNLSGLMECHHYGFTPSFISRLAKYCFESGGDLIGGKSSDEYVNTILKDYFGTDDERIRKAFKLISDSMDYYPPTDEMQYGPMRISTAYPLNLNRNCTPPVWSEKERLGICTTMYKGMDSIRCGFTPHCVRIRPEIKMLKKAVKMIEKGTEILKSLEKPTEYLKKTINLLEYMICSFYTAINVKEFYILKSKLQIAKTPRACYKLINQIKQVGEREILNAKKSIAFAERDSHLGFESSMGYQGDRRHIEWKIKQVRYMMDVELKVYLNCLKG